MVLVEACKIWLRTIAGVCGNPETSKKVSLVINNLLNLLSLKRYWIQSPYVIIYIKQATNVCGASLGTYLRYFSSLIFYICISTIETETYNHMNRIKKFFSIKTRFMCVCVFVCLSGLY